jgi:hypothetical protein
MIRCLRQDNFGPSSMASASQLLDFFIAIALRSCMRVRKIKGAPGLPTSFYMPYAINPPRLARLPAE